MKLMPNRGNYGKITSYRISIGSAEARKVGFVDSEGNPLELEKIIDEENKQIVFRLKTEE